jgi:hypothetical protein
LNRTGRHRKDKYMTEKSKNGLSSDENCRVVREKKQEEHEKQDNLTFERPTGAS